MENFTDLLGVYLCPSDGRIYEITEVKNMTKTSKEATVFGHGVDTFGDGVIRIPLSVFNKQLADRIFIKGRKS